MKNYSRTFSGIPCRPMLRCAWIWFIRVFFATVKLFRVLSVGSSLFYCVAWVFGLSIKHEAGISNIQYSQHFPYFVILYITIASPPLPRRRSPMTGCPGWVPPARLRPSSFGPDFLSLLFLYWFAPYTDLEELYADGGEHELKQESDEHDVVDGANRNDHTLNHVLFIHKHRQLTLLLVSPYSNSVISCQLSL